MNADPHNTDLAFLSVADLGARLASGAVSSRGLTELYLQRINAHNGALNAFITIMADEALAAADASELRATQRSRRALRPSCFGVGLLRLAEPARPVVLQSRA